MFVACSTLCFGDRPLEAALRQIAELEFNKYRPGADRGRPAPRPLRRRRRPRGRAAPPPERAEPDPLGARPGLRRRSTRPTLRKRFEAICRFAKPLTVAVLTMPAAPIGTPIEQRDRPPDRPGERRQPRGPGPLGPHRTATTLTADPAVAARALRRRAGPRPDARPEPLRARPPRRRLTTTTSSRYVQNAHFRDTGKNPGEEQVRVGQGRIDYARIVNLLARHGYNRALTVAILNDGDCPFDAEVEVRKLKLLLESLI